MIPLPLPTDEDEPSPPPPLPDEDELFAPILELLGSLPPPLPSSPEQENVNAIASPKAAKSASLDTKKTVF
ncbi:MAG: hypothetical protein FWF67_01545 [Fibromonadales bacterium]|nr:hypothetical protein [Fibromonadales bacterium]